MTLTRIGRLVAGLAALAIGVAGVGAPPTGAAMRSPSVARSAVAQRSTASATDRIAGESRHALALLQTDDVDAYLASVVQLARLVAPRAGVDTDALIEVWRMADADRMTALLSALGQVGTPYRRNSARPNVAFDCSGLVSWAWRAAGTSLPRNSRAIMAAIPGTTLAAAQPGDVLWYPGHVMMSLGVGRAMVHAPGSGKRVEVKLVYSRHLRQLKVGDPLA